MMKTVIMAGGKGTRISSLARDIPKPMIKIAGKPVLEREIESLKQQGFTDFIITISHLGHVIRNHFGDGSGFGVHIEYYDEKEPLGNAGALFKIKDQLDDDFLLINGDVLFDVDLNRFARFHYEKGAKVSLLTHPNDHPYDSGLIIADKDMQVERWLAKEDERPLYYKNRVNAGIHIVSPEILNVKIDKEKIDLDRDLLKPLCGRGMMYAYDSSEYVKDMGTPERYEMVAEDLLSGKVKRRSLLNKQKAVFLDRDGTINKYVGFLRDIDDFELNKDAAEAIRMINKSDYLCIVVTNQPVIARGEVTYEQLDRIHDKMETLLGEQGAFIDRLYFCPHHPHSGFPGEIRELKFDCDCRKPKPGMLLKAAQELNIDLDESWMIGDSDIDMEAGRNAGCKCIRIETDGSLVDAVKRVVGERYEKDSKSRA